MTNLYYDEINKKFTKFRYLVIGSPFHNSYFIGRTNNLKTAEKLAKRKGCNSLYCRCGGASIRDLAEYEHKNEVIFEFLKDNDEYGEIIQKEYDEFVKIKKKLNK